MLKLTFNLKVDRAELGAILRDFNPSVEKDIPASEFLRYFIRLGIDGRDQLKAIQRSKQMKLTQQAEEEAQKKLAQTAAKLSLEADYNFSNQDEKSAIEKLKSCSSKYDRYAPGAVALDGFECESLDASDFKDLVRRVFNLTLSSSELGFLMKKYDELNNGRVYCKKFLNDFLKMGQEVRYKMYMEQLEMQRNAAITATQTHEEKIAAVLNSETVEISDRYTDQHLQSAIDKLTDVAIKYDKVRGVSLISFEPVSLTPLEFKKALKRTFNMRLTAEEMGAMVNYFDKDQSNTVCRMY